MEKFNVFGFSGNLSVKFDDVFETFLDDDTFFAETKEVYKHEDEDNLNFNYRYAIEINRLDGNEFCQLYLVPTYDSLGDKQKKNVLDCCGVDENQINSFDICCYGYAVPIANETFNDGMIDDNVFDGIANIIETINSMRGFYLDKPVNMIGTTGWDLLDSAINGSDWIKETFKRYEN